MKSRLPLIVAMALGIIAVLAVYSYIRQMKLSVRKEIEPIGVLVAGKQIKAGDRLTMSSMAIRNVPKKYVGDRAVLPQDAETLAGRVVRYNLQEGQPILWSDVGEMKMGGLSAQVAGGERAMTITVDDVTGVGGLIQPNDHIDILGTFESTAPRMASSASASSGKDFKAMQEYFVGKAIESASAGTGGDVVALTLLQNVTVLATGKKFSEVTLPTGQSLRRGEEEYESVTLLVTPAEAQLLVFAQGYGELTLTLRNPEDISIVEGLPRVTVDSIPQIAPTLTRERMQRIEVIRGKVSTLE